MMEKVVRFIEKFNMIVKGDKVIAGISGGADSVCLLFVLLKLKEEMGIDVVAVHVNHGIRGASARADEEFVVRLCELHQINCVVYHENVESIAKKRKQSVEEAGRIVRREAFEKTLAREGGTKIAMAHHQNDNAETLLMNLARGAGLKGLGGIRPVNGNVVRPLLCLDRQEIEGYLERLGCGYCQDETNDEDAYTRNRLRHFVIPVLEEQVNSRAVRHMNEAMEHLRLLQEYMEGQAAEAGQCCIQVLADGGIQILKGSFELQPNVIRSFLARKCIAEAAGAERNISMVHVEAVLDLLQKQSGRIRNLPYGVKAVRNYDGVVLKKADAKGNAGTVRKAGAEAGPGADSGGNGRNQENCAISPYIIEVPGTTAISEMNLTICSRILEKPEDFSVNQIPQKTYTKWFDYDIIGGDLVVRTKRSGDSIVIDKAGRRQKLKTYYINGKIPADQRDKVLLIADQDQIIWILGYRMSSAVQVTEKTRRVLEIKVTEEESNVRED